MILQKCLKLYLILLILLEINEYFGIVYAMHELLGNNIGFTLEDVFRKCNKNGNIINLFACTSDKSFALVIISILTALSKTTPKYLIL